ncbi:MAG: GNAT family N-acetyltransferase [Rudanella sp.]|nr:GNAT family N-acetyltransferase [Rudanella sp.]
MKLLPIHENIAENQAFQVNPVCDESLEMMIEYYTKIGFVPPWIGYYAELNGELVGAAGFKGKPVDGTVEIAYGTFEPYQQQGVGTAMCGCLVSTVTDPDDGDVWEWLYIS